MGSRQRGRLWSFTIADTDHEQPLIEFLRPVAADEAARRIAERFGVTPSEVSLRLCDDLMVAAA
jgi:hypothetical protein